MARELLKLGGVAVLVAGAYGIGQAENSAHPQVSLTPPPPAAAPQVAGFEMCTTAFGGVQNGPTHEWDCTKPVKEAISAITTGSAKAYTQDRKDPHFSISPIGLLNGDQVYGGSFTDYGHKVKAIVVYDGNPANNQVKSVQIQVAG